MSSKLLVVASVSLAQCVSEAEAYWNSRDPNQVGYAEDRGLGWQGWHHISGIPQWVTAWAFVALFIAIVFVFIKCGKEDFNMYPRDCLGYLKALCFGLLCALPCAWPPACIYFHYIKKKKRERAGQGQGQVDRVRWNHSTGRWEPVENNSTAQETDPEALPDYPDHPQTTLSGYPDHPILPYDPEHTTLPDYPDQSDHPILPYHPEQTTLPDYTDNLSPSAPPAEFATVSAAEIAAEEAAAAADAREAAEAAAALAAAEAAVAAAARSGGNEYEAPPSYDAAMRDEF